MVRRERPSGPDEARLAVELRLIDEAVALVASGRSRRVVVAGLPDIPLILARARRHAAGAGLRLDRLAVVRDGIVDVAIEPLVVS